MSKPIGKIEEPVLVELETKSPVTAKKGELKVSTLGRRPASSVRRSARSSRRPRKALSQLPPEIDATITVNKVFRYISQDASATQRSVTVGSILLSLGSVAIATTQLTSICSSFRIKKIVAYPAVTSTFLLEWIDAATTGLNVKDERKNRPLPSGITTPSKAVYTPPKNTSVGWWWDANANGVSLLALSGAVGTILDVYVEATVTNCGVNYQETGFTGLTVGAIYYPAFEGRATNDWAPVGRSNAT